MRYSPEHKEQTRERIIHAASRRFRGGGAGVGIGQLMKALKMTHGGFYRHFKNKNDLVIEAIRRAFDDMQGRMGTALAGAKPGHEIEAIIETYLSEKHCVDAAGGCPVAALAADIGRQPRAVREAFDNLIRSRALVVAQFMTGNEEERRRRATTLMSGMSGTLTVARAMADETLRRNFLEGARKTYIEAFARKR